VSNYVGWVLSATIAVLALDFGYDRHALLQRVNECAFMLDDLVSFIILWGGINAWFGNYIPTVFAIIFAIGLLRAERFDTDLLSP
jgi:putative membrane protein